MDEGVLGEGKSRGMVGPVACGRNGSLGFVVSCGGFLGFMGFLWGIWRVALGIQSKDVAKFDGKNVVDCWWDVETLWFLMGLVRAASGSEWGRSFGMTN
jgi:hypothetical protein